VLIEVIAQLVLAYVHAPRSATVNNDNTKYNKCARLEIEKNYQWSARHLILIVRYQVLEYNYYYQALFRSWTISFIYEWHGECTD
jgi:hypothetical protein